MNKKIQPTSLEMASHLTSEKNIKRFNEASEARNDADYECFMMLRELSDNDMLTTKSLRKTLQNDVGIEITADEADDCAEDWSAEVDRVLKLRTEADLLFTNAMRGT